MLSKKFQEIVEVILKIFFWKVKSSNFLHDGGMIWHDGTQGEKRVFRLSTPAGILPKNVI